MLQFILLSLFCCFTNNFALVPPMKIPLKVNGTFCEYRESHFHGGIDLSTQKITGHDIQAVAAGTLYRVKNIVHGEGKALYIRHQNGDISVYAHLESFSPKIQKYLNTKSLSKTYDIFPSKMIQFLEGELIGYSGESGAGYPHLHFEMRSSISKSEKRSMYLSGISDTIAPTIRNVYLAPFKSKKPIVSLQSNQVVHGKYGIALNIDDRMDGSYSKCSIYRLRLLDNDVEIYNAKFETIHYGKSPNTQMHFVGSHTHLSPTQYVYKMYKDFDKPSSYISNIVNDGVLSVGDHKLQIEVEDFFGNISKKTIHLKIASHDANAIDRSKLLDYQGNFSLIQSLRSVQNTRAEIESYAFKELDKNRIEIIKISPSYLFFMKKAQLIYRSEDTDKLYLSRWDPFVKKWKSLSTKTYHRFVSSDIRSTGVYSVKKDLYAPFIGQKIYRYKGLRKAFEYIKVNDVESGVDRDTIRLTCNGKTRSLDYDSDRNWILLDSKVTNCLHPKIQVCDKVSNCTERKY